MIFKNIDSENEMKKLGAKIGSHLHGGDIVELIGDVGSGKTTLAKGIARGLGVKEEVSSPSFTIKKTYIARDNLTFNHYDFYRLNDAGIMLNDIDESICSQDSVNLIEWGNIVKNILPIDRLSIKITTIDLTSRRVEFFDNDIRNFNFIKEL